ncbi:hypothetical protein G8770_06215 [Aestuariicella hydrocarbonica]|uniref:Uncharacterized protein n=1 Tax=Pseudomaricurvus hydrocarbonicus TaxID=1470433 RepID=A0A9E5JTR2_9GAMM|nr:hypothetical protein [Aestuariicella hydrocarbonica]NHO65134.1 hypothetical protein [Aestuariicella hydrocarbonica]
MSATVKYLSQYAEVEVRELATWPDASRYQHALVIPAYDEPFGFIQQLLHRHPTPDSVLVILVINRPDHIDACAANDQLFKTLSDTLPIQWAQGTLSLYGNPQRGVLCVDRHHHPIPKKQGVGLARKIGCDLAAQLIADGFIASPWIHSTDADAFLPDEYFNAAQQLAENSAAATYDFQHRRGKDLTSQATEHYERTLHHYVNGLKHAGSPYAYHTIGSILVLNHKHYCQARGFPKRSGGEDFYLLNKLAKLGAIEHLTARVELQPRLSHRVPFGTGPATLKILHALEEDQPVLSYDPVIFDHLQECLATLTAAITSAEPPAAALLRLPAITQSALASLDFPQCLKHLQQNPNPDWQSQHFHHWLDAFRTLKFVRFLQAEAFPPKPL